ncbi:peptidoglycan-binding protein [Streptomyces naphthomycinicus]|uniref:peptidoglycan-binding protein n=1 Tax=Streptomyces naphthomycinicus TaxID=2872625 RepID=UPI001CED0D95|nr:peptidoglycan-binding protein [Streptomyces sp. TML10]
MTAPVFEEIDPASDCDCPGCVDGRRPAPGRLPGRGHPAARSVVVVAAASAALGAAPPAAALAPAHSPHRQALPGDGEPDTPQGKKAPLHGSAGQSGGTTTAPIPATTRTDIIKRAKVWVAAKVPYSMSAFWSDGYRQDCSGYVSMAWGLPSNEWTGSLDQFGTKIAKEELQPGDILLYHNPDNPEKGSHVVIFGGWTDYTHTYYTVYEQTPPHARSQTTPYPYWSNTGKYVPYRYKGVTKSGAGTKGATGVKAAVAHPGGASSGPGAAGRGKAVTPGPAASAAPAGPASHGVPGYPGRQYFRPGATNDHVTRLGVRLAEKGFGRFYALGPGPHWGEADRRAVEAFQRTQGWRGGAADGYPGPETWRRLFA